MVSVQRYLSGCSNSVRHAAVSASSVRASTAIERVSAMRTGGGRVRLAGSYTGHEALDVEVRIAAAAGLSRASSPVFSGVGNGVLEVLAVDASASVQGLTLTLSDLGIPTESAGLDVRQVRLVARAEGDAGNSIRITVDPRLQTVPTNYSLLSDWQAGVESQAGEQWDFGGLPLSSRGEIDALTPRLQIGNDPQVFRAWRQYHDGAWHHGLSPTPDRLLPKGAAVRGVSGGYVVTVTDGVDTEVFGDADNGHTLIVTFYDLLTALSGSVLVDVAGVVAADRVSGGQAAIDVPLRTQAWLQSMSGKAAVVSVVVPADAPTQSLVVRCIDANAVGRERWSVTGDVTGVGNVAVTGAMYASAAIQFLIPPMQAQSSQSSGEWGYRYTPVARSKDDDGLPSVCIRPFVFGAAARARTLTLRYEARPAQECQCSQSPAPRVPVEHLGVIDQVSSEDAAFMQRQQMVYAWRDVHASATTGWNTDAQYRIFSSMSVVLSWRHGASDVMLDALVRMIGQAQDAQVWVDWDALWSEFVADTYIMGGGRQARYLDRYRAAIDRILLDAGILPASVSELDAGGVWVDYGDGYWWVDVDGNYLPVFTNRAYVSARRNPDGGAVYSTQEFGFGLVIACEDRLKEGDTITVTIGQVDSARAYQVGDEVVIQTVAAGPAWFSGGIDGTDEQTWRVQASASGVLHDYVVPTDGSVVPSYSAAGVELRIAPGGIPFVLGDAFSLAVEAGQYQWRKGGQAWQAVQDIPADGTALLTEGLQIHFDAGTAPSFVPGDSYTFRVHQPHAASHIQRLDASAWGWDGGAVSIDVDLGNVQAVTAVAVARADLPPQATVTVELSIDAVAWDSIPLPIHNGLGVAFLPMSANIQHVRISIVGAPGGSLGWVYAGMPLTTDHHASSCVRRRRWAVSRGSGLNPAALYAGAGDGWSLSWSPDDWVSSRLLEADIGRLIALLNYAHEYDEPLLFVPHYLHPQDASLVRFADDALEINDRNEYQADDAMRRSMSAALQLEPVYA